MLRPHLLSLSRFCVPSLALGVCALGGCALPATNPCDPLSPADVQRQGTRLAGRVVDPDGAGVAGVTVAVLGLSRTAVSGDGGAWQIDDVPPSPQGYTVRAEPPAPLAGGALVVPSLGCQERRDDLDVAVVAPLEAPAVELVRAVSATSLLVAFGSGDPAGTPLPDGGAGGPGGFYEGDDRGFRSASDVSALCADKGARAARAWRVQVRPPFEGWRDAVITAFPWIDGAASLDVDALASDRVDDFCAAAVCQQFSYLEPALGDGRARCANVVGFKDEGGVHPLVPFGSYEVRVLTERRLDDALRERFALPERVASAAPGSGVQTSLVPSTLLPLVDADGAPLDARGRDVAAVVATAGGRFALVEEDGVTVTGVGGDVLGAGAASELAAGAPQGAIAEDDATDAAVDADFRDDGDGDVDSVALSALPAGAWLRVVKESDARAVVEKVFVGASALAGRNGPDAATAAANDAAEAALPLPPSSTTLGALRAVSYLDPGAAALADEAANPGDAYVLLYAHGFVLVENGVAGALSLQALASAFDGSGAFVSDWDDADKGSGADGDCAGVVGFDGGAAFGAVDAPADRNGAARSEVAVCYDVAAASAASVDFTDAAVVAGAADVVHVIADAENDRVVVVGTAALRGLQGRLSDQLRDVAVGRAPVAVTASRQLSCDDANDANAADDAGAVVLVANAGSADVSVVKEDADGEFSEAAVVSLAGAPADFLDDSAGPDCDAPFVWVVAADGRLFPIDMSRLEVPLCGGAPCQISSRGRARAGAVAHVDVTRALVAGSGLVAELGFFRPAALSGGAFLGGDDDFEVAPGTPDDAVDR